MRIFGVEFRLKGCDPRWGNYKRGVAVASIDVQIELESPGLPDTITVLETTLHTDLGNIDLADRQIEFYYVDPKTPAIALGRTRS